MRIVGRVEGWEFVDRFRSEWLVPAGTVGAVAGLVVEIAEVSAGTFVWLKLGFGYGWMELCLSERQLILRCYSALHQ